MFESALAYQPVLRMADNATLFKWIAKTTGYRFGIMPTFMAKPYADQPGCSGHVHLSLRNSKGENIFAVKEDEIKNGREGAAFEDTKRISEQAEWFLAGVLKGLPDIVSTVAAGPARDALILAAGGATDAMLGPNRQWLQAARRVILGARQSRIRLRESRRQCAYHLATVGRACSDAFGSARAWCGCECVGLQTGGSRVLDLM